MEEIVMEGYLNPFTVTLHFLAYLMLSFISFKVHKNLRHATQGDYQVGPFEAVLFMWVPFFYLFWNTYLIEKICRRFSGQESSPVHGFLGLHLQSWLILTVSPLVYPDNMDKIAPFISIPSFVLAFGMLIHFERKSRLEKDIA
jgi:hypothetical protein